MNKRDWFEHAFKKRVWLLIKSPEEPAEIDGYVVNVGEDCVSILPHGAKQDAKSLFHLDYSAILTFAYPESDPWDEIKIDPRFRPFDPDSTIEG